MKHFLILLFLVFLLISCAKQNPLEKAIASKNKQIKKVIDSVKNYEVQVLFTKILQENGKTTFKDYSYRVDKNTYFYPASSVKFPIAVLALQKMNQNKKIHKNTVFNSASDTTKTTFANEIKKIFAVSDNLAYSRLFDYLGQNYINNQLKSKGITARISHRFSVDNPYDINTKSVYFYYKDSVIYSENPIQNDSIKNLSLDKIEKGIGYTVGDSLVEKPMDFSLKNYMPLISLHQLMKQLVFPELFPKEKRFDLTEEDRNFLINTMATLPKDAGYTSKEYYDSYVKFFLFGDSKEPMPSHIKIHNKVGFAYGYLTDCAFIENTKTKKKYIITATIHVNKNKIYNDGIYEYDTVGFPFLAQLGRELVPLD